MTRTLTITVNEWAAVRDGHLWIVRDGCTRSSYPFEDDTPPADLLAAAAPCDRCRSTRIDRSFYFGEDRPCPDCRITLLGECPTCNGDGCDIDFCLDCGDEYEDPCERHAIHEHAPCGECCPQCSGYGPAQLGSLVLGYAYPASKVMPIVRVGDGHGTVGRYVAIGHLGRRIFAMTNERFPVGLVDISADLAHYGDPAGLVGKWALQLAVT